VKPERFAILPLIDNVCDMMRLRAEESGLKLTRAYLPGCDEIVSDKHACKQILLNLLSNALKFTPAPGEVNVTAKPEGNSLLIAVSDTGIGIAPRELERLGNPFFQAQSAHDRPYEGTGLGLSIVRGLLGLQGGAIRVESEPGKGTCVIVRLPLDCRPFLGKTASQGSDPSVANSFPTEVKETGGAAAARIEILARRSPDFVPEHQPKEMMVKKIA
jgi:cell cycle sensor histidine kinase DivJ